ncbi:putative zinc-binding dehydrogenase family oxidoreductase [Xylaria grammica]|nr:putative zinc-binding dehydrogenase family oxidoreductase [Xylaria grammica]
MPQVVSQTLPLSQRMIIEGLGGVAEIADCGQLPSLLPGTVLVRTEAVALNPSDYKMGRAFPCPGAVVGHDFAGYIIAISPDIQTHFRVGDRVCGAVHGSNPADESNGAFAQYVRASPGLLLHIPADMAFEQAAGLGLGLATTCLALWGTALRLEWNPEAPCMEPPVAVLVYGASTATGTMALQLLRLSGLAPIAICSTHNFKLVYQYGATIAFDISEPNLTEKIRKHTNNELRFALDCITDLASVTCCYASMRRIGGRYACLEFCPPELQTRRAVRAEFVMALEVFGKDVDLPGGYGRQSSAEKKNEAVRWFRLFQKLLDAGEIRPHPFQLLPPNFEGVMEGLALLQRGDISGTKLVALV